jgi:uncharacterized protein (TIGR02145 family)
VFGSTDADAALLAISILLQGDRTEAEMLALLAEISLDMAEDGLWNGSVDNNADSVKASMAEWILHKDIHDSLKIFRSNVEKWGLSSNVPNFEKYVRLFWSGELGLDACGGVNAPVGIVKNVTNDNSNYFAATYTDTTGKGKFTRFICVDADSVKWRIATIFEQDTFGIKCTDDDVGKIFSGVVNPYDKYYCSVDGWISTVDQWNWSIPKELLFNPEISYDTMIDPRDSQSYKIVKIGDQVWMAENLNYEIEYCPCYESVSEYCNITGRYYSWSKALEACPVGWHLPSNVEWRVLFDEVGGASNANMILKSQVGWMNGHNGIDSVGFAMIPAGDYWGRTSVWAIGDGAYFWTSTEYNSGYAYAYIASGSSDFARAQDVDKHNQFSVRCVKD